MKWLYVIGGALGAVVAFAFMMVRTFARFRTVAESIGRTDVEWNVLLVVGGSAGLLMIPVGIGIGLIIAVVINLVMLRLHVGPYNRAKDSDDGSSWVSRRDRVANSSRNDPQ